MARTRPGMQQHDAALRQQLRLSPGQLAVHDAIGFGGCKAHARRRLERQGQAGPDMRFAAYKAALRDSGITIVEGQSHV